MGTKKKFMVGEGYEMIMPENITKCVMCGNSALRIAPETNEPLCKRCVIINDEARGNRVDYGNVDEDDDEDYDLEDEDEEED